MNTITELVFKKLNIAPFEKFKIHGESMIYRVRHDLIVEFKHPIINDWCIDKENYLSKLITDEKLIDNGKYNIREQLFINKLKDFTKYKYITRRDDGKLQIFEDEPVKINSSWVSYHIFMADRNYFNIENHPEFDNILNENDFEFIKSSDTVPYYIY